MHPKLLSRALHFKTRILGRESADRIKVAFCIDVDNFSPLCCCLSNYAAEVPLKGPTTL